MVGVVEPEHNAIVYSPETRGSYGHMREIKSPLPVHVVVLTHSERHRPGVLYIHTHLLNHYHRFFTVVRVRQVCSCEVLVSVTQKPDPNVNRRELKFGYGVGEENSPESLGLIAVDRVVP